MTTLQLEKTLNIKTERGRAYHFMVVGAGGTGGHLLPNLIRQIGIRNREFEAMDAEELPHNRLHSITIVDADLVEAKNLLRQNFTQGDLGKNKAEVMARRYGRAFGVAVGHIPHYITSPHEFLGMIADAYQAQQNKTSIPNRNRIEPGRNLEESFMREDYDTTLVLIDATDNNKTRLIIEETARYWRGPVVVLSSGNEQSAGQVVCSFVTEENQSIGNLAYHQLRGLQPSLPVKTTPTFYEIFPNSPLEKLPTEVSCAEQTVSAPQNMITNVTAANILFNFANKLLAYEPISTFLIFFDTDGMGQRSYRFTEEDVEAAMSLTPNNFHKWHFLSNGMRQRTQALNGEESVRRPTWREAVRLQQEAEAAKAREVEQLLAGVRSAQ